MKAGIASFSLSLQQISRMKESDFKKGKKRILKKERYERTYQ